MASSGSNTDKASERLRSFLCSGSPAHTSPTLSPGTAPIRSLATARRAGSAARGPAARLVDLAPILGDFADTAAAVSCLDLVITVDTAVAHLAGALATPVWTLLPFAADWRWLEDRTDSPWYPTMRLFRQPAPGDWTSVVSAVAAALHDAALSLILSPC